MRHKDDLRFLLLNDDLFTSATRPSPDCFANRLQSHGYWYCLNMTANLKGEARLQAIKQLLQERVEKIEYAIETIQHEREFSPVSLFGFELTAESITSSVTFYLSLLLSLTY